MGGSNPYHNRPYSPRNIPNQFHLQKLRFPHHNPVRPPPPPKNPFTNTTQRTTFLLGLTYILYLALNLYETLSYSRHTLSTLTYLRLQSLKIYIAFLELALLGIFTLLDENDSATEKLMVQIVGLTAISRVPLLFGPLLCWWLWDESEVEGQATTGMSAMNTPWRTPVGGDERDFGVFEGQGERAPLLIRIHPPQEEEAVV